jgi:hypothetical protein
MRARPWRLAVAFGVAIVFALSAPGLARAEGFDASAVDGGAAPDATSVSAADADAAPLADAGKGALVPVRGVLIARGGRRHLHGASVTIDGEPAGESDELGRFDAEAVPGRHHLQIAAAGFVPADVVIDVDDGGWRGTVRLEPGGQAYETVVAAKQPAAAVRMTGEEARSTPGATGDPFRAIESLPGVSQIVWPFALYAIRGANPGNTGFFLDGMRVPALFHFALGPSIVHPYLIEKLAFYPGGYPIRFGGYVSGAVVAETAPPPADIARFAADVRFYDAGGLATSPWDGGRGTVAVAGRYSFTGLLISQLFSGVSLGYADYQLRVDHAFGEGRLTLFALGSFDMLDITQPDLGDATLTSKIGDATLNFHRLDLRWDRPTAGGRLLVRTTFSTDRAASNLFDSPIAVRAYAVAPRVAFTQPLEGAGGAIEIGIDAEAQRFRTDVVMTPETPTLGDLAQSRGALTAGIYAGATLNLARLSVDPGIRYARYLEQDTARGAFEPRLTVRLKLLEGLSVDGTIGRFSQMPSLPLAVAGFEAFGLRDFGLQTSTQTALGIDARLRNGASLRVTGYHQWLHVSDLRSTFAHDVRTREFLDMRDGRGYGVEAMLRLPERARLSGWVAYTLSWSVRDFDGVYGDSDWDQRHILNLVGTVRLPRGWSVGGRFHYNTGRPYPVEGTNGTEYFRLPAFWQLDTRAAKRVILDRATLDFYFEVGNATLTREVVAIQRQEDGTPKRLGFRIFLPSFGLHAEW